MDFNPVPFLSWPDFSSVPEDELADAMDLRCVTLMLVEKKFQPPGQSTKILVAILVIDGNTRKVLAKIHPMGAGSFSCYLIASQVAFKDFF